MQAVITLASRVLVEFARDEMAKGHDVVDAALEGAKLRLPPIFMTSFAFILGCLPLMLASGSGAVGRQILGTVVVTSSQAENSPQSLTVYLAMTATTAVPFGGFDTPADGG